MAIQRDFLQQYEGKEDLGRSAFLYLELIL